MNKFAQEDHHHVATKAEHVRHAHTCFFTQRNTADYTIATNHRSDFEESLAHFHEARQAALYRGEKVTESIPRHQRVRQRDVQHRHWQRQDESQCTGQLVAGGSE